PVHRGARRRGGRARRTDPGCLGRAGTQRPVAAGPAPGVRRLPRLRRSRRTDRARRLMGGPGPHTTRAGLDRGDRGAAGHGGARRRACRGPRLAMRRRRQRPQREPAPRAADHPGRGSTGTPGSRIHERYVRGRPSRTRSHARRGRGDPAGEGLPDQGDAAGARMKLQVWTGRSNLRQLNLRDRHTVAPDEPDLVFHSTVDVTQASFTVGRSTRSDVVLDDGYVSRYALRFSKQGDEWWVEYLNRHKAEHRRWAQQHQPPKCDGWECLAVGEHAFLINGGANRDRSFIILVSIDESGPNGSRVNATDPVPM